MSSIDLDSLLNALADRLADAVAMRLRQTPNAHPRGEWITAEEAKAELAIPASTFRRICRDRLVAVVPNSKPYRARRVDVEAFANARLAPVTGARATDSDDPVERMIAEGKLVKTKAA